MTMHDLTAERIADYREDRRRCLLAARVARAFQSDDAVLELLDEARELHEKIMHLKRRSRRVPLTIAA